MAQSERAQAKRIMSELNGVVEGAVRGIGRDVLDQLAAGTPARHGIHGAFMASAFRSTSEWARWRAQRCRAREGEERSRSVAGGDCELWAGAWQVVRI